MRTRVITSFLGLAVLLPIMYFSDRWIFVILISLLSFISMHEIIRCIGQQKRFIETFPAYIIAAFLPAFARITKFQGIFIVAATALFFIYMFYLLCISMLSKRDYDLDEASVLFTLSFYIIMGYTCIVLMRGLPNGEYVYLLAFIGAWCTDTFAFFCGKLFGKHKLVPEISPKKTIEGAIGGTLFCVLGFLIFGFAVGKIFDEAPNYLALGVIGFISACVAQFGDLITSSIKRKYGKKDFGSILPGHGGIMDRFDSIIAIGPFIYITSVIFPVLSLFSS